MTSVHLYSYECHTNLVVLINELGFITPIYPAYKRVYINKLLSSINVLINLF